jgi:Peptidase family M28
MASLLPTAALLSVLTILAAFSLLQLDTSTPKPLDAPATEFSAERAGTQLRTFARHSRGIGMPGHDIARDELMDTLRDMGLDPQVQTTTAVSESVGSGRLSAGTVSNVLVRLPGLDSTGAIALDAHYDSGPTGPGAADCGTCVTGALEILRALQAGAPLRNDVIVVFADAEEKEMLGSAAFTEQHPWADDVRVALGFDRGGSGGASLLYATGSESGWLTGEFLQSAPGTQALSLGPALVALLPDQRLDCDLGDYTDRDIQGLGFVYGADGPAYHTSRDNADVADLGSVQQEGDHALAFVRAMGERDLSDLPREPDRVFATVAPGVVIHYPASWAVPLAALATLLLLAVVSLGLRSGVLVARRVAAGTAAVAVAMPVVVVLVALAWAGVRWLNPDWQVFQVGTPETPLHVAGLVAVSVALVAGLHALLRRRIPWPDLSAAVLLLWMLPLWAASLAAPTVSYLMLWPLLFSMLPLGWKLFGWAGAESWPWRVGVLAIAAIPVVVLLPLTLYLVAMLLTRAEGLSGAPMLGLLGLFVVPVLFLLFPQFDFLGANGSPRARWLVPAVAAGMAVVLFGWAAARSGFDSEHPRPDRIAYELDADNGTARWISADRRLDAWTAQFFPGDPSRADAEVDGEAVSAFVAQAPIVDLAVPQARVASDKVVSGGRELRLRLSSPRNAPTLAVTVDAPSAISAATLEGVPLELGSAGSDGRLELTYAGLPRAGVTLTLSLASDEPVSIELADSSHGLPQIPGFDVRPRPDTFTPGPGMMLDPTTARTTFLL